MVDRQGALTSRELVYCALQEGLQKKDLIAGRKILSLMISTGLESTSVIGDHLIRLFASCGSLPEASFVFDHVSGPSVYTWNSILLAHTKLGDAAKALRLYQKMYEFGTNPDRATFLCILQACGSTYSVEMGRLVHHQMVSSGFDTDNMIGNTLVDMYAKCDSLEEACQLFDRLSVHNVVAWTAMVGAYVRCSDGISALKQYDKMLDEGIKPSKVTYLLTFKACTRSRDVELGRLVHSQFVQSGFAVENIHVSVLTEMYGKCGCLQEAQYVFNNLLIKDIVSYGALIASLVQHGNDTAALELFKDMQWKGLKPDKFIFSSVLRACASAKALDQGGQIHEQLKKNGYESDVVVGSALVDMYAKCGSLEKAKEIFSELPDANAVSWSAIIGGYVHHGLDMSALQLFENMQWQGLQANEVTYQCVLKACASLTRISCGRILHDQIVRNHFESERVIGSSIIELYAKFGCLNEAHCVFNQLLDCDVMTWGVLIEGYLQQEQGIPVLELFELMLLKGVQPDAFIFMCALKACCTISSIKQLRWVHYQIINNGFDEDQVVVSTLIDGYAKCGSLQEACKVFDIPANQDVASWGAMIGGHALHGQCLSALQVYQGMQQAGVQPTKITLLNVLKACSVTKSRRKAIPIHDLILRTGLESDLAVVNALIDVYAKCGNLEEARKVFSKSRTHDVVSWGSMIAAYTEHGYDALAIEMYSEMQQDGTKPSKVLFLCMLKACANLGALEHGRLMHDQVIRSGFELDKVIGCTLVDMYAKCGSLEEGHKVFGSLTCQDTATWGVLIAGYVQAGNLKLAKKCLHDMQQDGLKLNEMVLTNVLAACNQMGLFGEGYWYFCSVAEDNNITPTLEHYSCIVDLLSRSGRLQEAHEFLKTMPVAPDGAIWMSLLTGCKLYGDEELARHCFDQVVCLSSSDASAYVLMSNIYSEIHMLENANLIQELRGCAGAEKKPGIASMEFSGKVHEFIVGGNYRSVNEEICFQLENLSKLCKEGGYFPHLDSVLGTDPELKDVILQPFEYKVVRASNTAIFTVTN